jgi:hypothetical protein
VLATGFAASLPVIFAMVHAVVVGWVPLGDDAMALVRSYDVLTERSPLVGQSSGAVTSLLGEQAFCPGPLLFWLLALPVRFPGTIAPALTVGLVGVASVVGTVALAHRRGGRPFMFVVAIAIPLMLASHPLETYSDVFNSSAPLLPFMLVIFLAWSLACGEYRLLPLTVLVASFTVQSHLTFVAPTLGVTAVGTAGLAIGLGRRRRSRSVLRWSVAAALVGLVCWSAPLIDQAIHRPGNFTLLYRAATAGDPTLGFDAGLRGAIHAVGVLPWWLEAPRDALERIGDLSAAPGAVAFGSALLVLLGLLAVTLAGWRRRRSVIWATGAFGLILCAAVAADAAATPTAQAGTVVYTLRWAEPAGMCVWLLLGWALATLLLPRRRSLAARHPTRLAPPALAAVALAASAVVVGADPPDEPFDEMRTINARLKAELPSGTFVRIDRASSGRGIFLAVQFQAGSVYALRRDGVDVVAPSISRKLGAAYDDPGHGYVVQVAVDRPPRGRGRTIARFALREPAARDSSELAVRVTLARTRAVR